MNSGMETMIDQEEEIIQQIAENTEHTAEETQQEEKLFTQADMDRAAGSRAARAEAKIRKEYERTYGPLVDLLKAGTGKESVEEITETFRDYYGGKGVTIPQSSGLSQRDIQTLAISDAQEIIDGGYEEVVDEMNRLAKIGVANMTDRDKIIFRTLTDHRNSTDRGNALAAIGVPKEVYNGAEFKNFAKQFQPNVPIEQVYAMFEKNAGTSKAEPIGSMKSGARDTQKTFYTPEEVDRLRPEDLDDPVVFRNVRTSMLRWRK